MKTKLHDSAAERSVLSSIVQYGKEAYYDVSDIIDVDTFVDENNQILYKCLCNICEQDKAVDVPTIISSATELGVAEIVSTDMNMKFLRSLFNLPVEQSNARKHAAKIKKLQIARIAQQKHRECLAKLNDVDGSESIDQILSISEKPLLDLSFSLNNQEDTKPKQIAEEIDQYLQEREENPAVNIGVPSPYPRYNQAIGGGFRRGGVNLIAARPKAQPLDAKILTPSGWVLMGDIKVGDEICSPSEGTCYVQQIFPFGFQPVVELTFSNGAKVQCCYNHFWKVRVGNKEWEILDTREILSLKGYGKSPIIFPCQSKEEEVELVDWREVGEKVVQCITVSAKDGLYITDDFIVTSNTGKTSLAKEIAIHVAETLKIPVLVLDTEMVKEDQMVRALASKSGVRINDIETGRFAVNPSMKYKIQAAAQELKGIPYKHKVVAGKPFDEILGVIRRWIKEDVGKDDYGKTNPCLVIYDYFKLMSVTDIKDMQEYQALGFQISKLSDFSKEMDFSCLAFTQINRDGVTKETSDVLASSDRLLWLCHSVAIYKKKTPEEIADSPQAGNMKLIPLDCRYGGSLDEGDYINMFMEKDLTRIREGKTHFELRGNPMEELKDEAEDGVDI